MLKINKKKKPVNVYPILHRLAISPPMYSISSFQQVLYDIPIIVKIESNGYVIKMVMFAHAEVRKLQKNYIYRIL